MILMTPVWWRLGKDGEAKVGVAGAFAQGSIRTYMIYHRALAKDYVDF